MDPYIGEIRIFGFNFAPKNWALCNGQLLSIAQNTALFSILGTMYGGDGKTTFALPNVQNNIPLHFGQGKGLSPYVQGQVEGEAQHTLITQEMPIHTHTAMASTAGNPSPDPTNRFWGRVPTVQIYNTAQNTTMNPLALDLTGQNQPHENRQPYLALNFCICMSGLFPPRN